MSILVTGATGHLGHLIVDALLREGTPASEIVATGRSLEKLAGFADQGVTVARLDYTDSASIAEAVTGVNTVVLVSSSEVGQRVAQHTAVIDAAKAAGVSHIIYTSAPRATTSALVLAPEHKATEELITASGIPFTILRNGWYTENYAGTIVQAAATGVVAASVGDGLVSSASRADFADAAAVVARGTGHEGKVYELSGDTAWSHSELAATIGEVLGRDVVFESLTPEAHLAALTAAGLDEGTAGFVVALDGNIRDGLIGETSGDLGRLIGRPTTPLKDGLAALV